MTNLWNLKTKNIKMSSKFWIYYLQIYNFKNRLKSHKNSPNYIISPTYSMLQGREYRLLVLGEEKCMTFGDLAQIFMLFLFIDKNIPCSFFFAKFCNFSKIDGNWNVFQKLNNIFQIISKIYIYIYINFETLLRPHYNLSPKQLSFIFK